MSTITYPEFPGWRMIDRDELIQDGDVRVARVDIGDSEAQNPTLGENAGYKITPGAMISIYIGKRHREYACPSDLWQIYRRTGPRRLPSNKYFAAPLPLP